MDLSNNDNASVNEEPMKNADAVQALPPEADNQQFMGEDMGVDGEMGDYGADVGVEE